MNFPLLKLSELTTCQFLERDGRPEHRAAIHSVCRPCTTGELQSPPFLFCSSVLRWLRRRARRSRIFSGSSSRDRFLSRASRAQAARFTVDKLYSSTGIWCAPARTAHRTRDRRRFHTFPPPLALLFLTGRGQLRDGTLSSYLPAGACQRMRSHGWRARANGREADAASGVCMCVSLRDISRERSAVSRVPPLRIAAMHESATDVHVSVKQT